MIRPATPADIPALHALIESAYRGESAKAGWTHEADLLDGQRIDQQMLAEIIGDPQRVLLVSDDLIGCVCLTHKGDHAYLGLLTVAPNTQGNGLGRKLAMAAEAQAKDWGLNRMEMTVLSQRAELIAWYERLGYVNTGETAPFPDDTRFGVPKAPLHFVVLEKQL